MPAPRRDPPLRLDGRRHRLAAQPARRRRRLQPGVPRPPADRRARRDAVRRRRARSTPHWPRSSPATASRVAPYADAPGALAALPADAVLLIDPKRVTLGLREHARVRARRGDQPEHAAEEPQERRRGGPRARRDGRGRRRDVRVLRLVRGGARRPEAHRADHRADDRRAPQRGTRPPARLRRPELRHDRRVQRERRDAALPRDRGLARDDRGRRPAADRLRRPVPRRHHRHHAGLADRRGQRGAAARLHAGAEGHDGAEPHALPARHPVADARRDRARSALGARPRLRPRHRPRRRLLPERARRAADDLEDAARRRRWRWSPA